MNKVYNEIVKIVCEYYQVRRYDLLMTRNSLRMEAYNKARCIAIYLMREVTGDDFKEINYFFDNMHRQEYAGSKYNIVAYNMKKRKDYKREVLELLEICSQKINLEDGGTNITLVEQKTHA